MNNTLKKLAGLPACLSLSLVVSDYALSQGTLEEITVTAQKREQNLQEVPISMSVMTSEAIEQQYITETVSLAQAVPSLNFQAGFAPSSTNFNIRGVASYTFEGGIQPSVAMVVDGVSFARAGEFVADLADVERIEVLRGPQGTLFGRNTTAGAINITTRRPSTEFEGYFDASFTDDEEQLYRARVSGSLSDSVAGSLNVFYQDRAGHLKNVYPGAGDGGGMEAWGARVQLDMNLSDSVNLLFSGDYRVAEHGFSPQVVLVPEPELDGLFAGTNLRLAQQGNGDPELGQKVVDDLFKINVNDQDFDDQEFDSWGVSAHLTWNINDDLNLVSISAYREWYEAVNPDIDSGPGQLSNGGYGLPVSLAHTSITPSSSVPYSRPSENNYLTQELRLEHVGTSIDWVAGIFYTDFEESVKGAVDLYIPYDPVFDDGYTTSTQTDNSDELTAYSVFADATFHVTDTFDIYGGYRWTREEIEANYNSPTYLVLDGAGISDFDLVNNVVNFTAPVTPIANSVGSANTEINDWSARLGVSWQFSENSNLYATMSRSFVGVGADLSRTGSPDAAFLDPTTAKAFELGIKSMLLDNSLQINGAVFWQDVEDLQTSALLPGTITTVNLNAGDLDIFGAELDVTWGYSDYGKITAAVSYIDAEVKDLLQPCWPGQTVSKGCNLDSDGNLTSDLDDAVQTDMDGSAAPNTPELAYNIGIDHMIPLDGMPFDLHGSLNYVWQDDVNFPLNGDPQLVQDSYGLLNFSLSAVDKNERYSVTLFGKNVTDKEFYSDSSEASGFIARQYVRVTRGAQAYYGLRLKYNF
jgi:iron complex outermembrane recepter protein